jgi:hypothetical protein
MSYSMNTAEKRNTTIRLEDIPEPIRSEALKLDKNNDGDLSLGELAMAIDSLYKNRRTNKGLRKTILAFIVLTILLIAGIFGATIAGAILSKDFVVNPDGFATVKNSNALMQTTEAIKHNYGVNIGKMSNEELSTLEYITINKENLKFYVKGHARDRVLDRVMILVEGGTVTYDNRFIVDATGDAKRMLENAMGLDEFYMHPTDRRWLEGEEDDPTEAPVAAPTDVPTQGPTEPVTCTECDTDAQSDNNNQGNGNTDTTVGG